MKYFFGLIVLLFLLPVSAFSDKMNEDILFTLKRLSSYSFSPDGNDILLQVSKPNIEENGSETQLYLMPLQGGELRQITSSKSHNFGASWSPDGKQIVFLSTRSGKTQAYMINMHEGGEAYQITDMENGVSNPILSPDGKKLLFTSDVKLENTITDNYPKLDKINAMIYDDLPVRHWDHWLDEKYSHLFVMDLNTKEVKDLMKNEKFETPLPPFGGASQLAWSNDSKYIAYTSKKVENFESSTNSSIFLVNVETGATENITPNLPGYDMDPMFSPDGKSIAFHSMERAGFESDRHRLMIYDIATKKIKELSKNLDQNVNQTVWSPDSKYLYFHAGHNDGTEQIYKIDAKSGKFEVLTEGQHNFGDRGIDITSDGKTLIFNRRDYNAPSELYSMDLSTKDIKKISNLNDAILNNIDKVKIEAKWFTAKDGKKFHSWVIYPPYFDKNKKYPLITYCQGGPQQSISQFFSYGWNFLTMASRGYVIVAPNRRGCPGFGQDWTDAMSQDYGGMPMQDILVATDEMAKEEYIDKDRMSAIGASAGGYTVFWMAGNHEGRFSAFVSHCGMYNMESKYGSTEELFFPNWDNGGAYWESKKLKEYYAEVSPHSYAQNWDTPILIITGELDYRVPYTQSLEAFTAARAQNIPAKLIVYPEENHWVLKPQEKLFWYKEFFKFLDEYTK